MVAAQTAVHSLSDCERIWTMSVSRMLLARGAMLILLAGAAPLGYCQAADDASTTGTKNRGNRTMERFDTNGDGQIGSDEFRGPAEVFAQLDSNQDGSLAGAELLAARDMMRNREGTERRDGRQGRTSGADRQAAMLTRTKERLGATDEEWAVLQPQIQKVMELQMRNRPGTGGRRGQPQPGAPAAMPEAEALSKTLDDANASPERIEKAIDAYRDARKKNDAALKEAREELREMLTIKQEGVLVLSGMLD